MSRNPKFDLVDEAVEVTLNNERIFGINSLKDWERNMNLVWHASGVISNGGLSYFIEQGGDLEASAQAYADVAMPECASILRLADSLVGDQLDAIELPALLNNKADLVHSLSVAFWKSDESLVEKLYDYMSVHRKKWG